MFSFCFTPEGHFPFTAGWLSAVFRTEAIQKVHISIYLIPEYCVTLINVKIRFFNVDMF